MVPAAVVAAFLSALIVADAPAPRHEITDEPHVREILDDLLREARYGFAPEQAAFLVRNSSGDIFAISWPQDSGRNCVAWRGRLPYGTIAIVHTHPNWLPEPSRIDGATASRSGLPVYVVTLTGIARTDGGAPYFVTREPWSSGSRRGRSARSASSFVSVSQSRRE